MSIFSTFHITHIISSLLFAGKRFRLNWATFGTKPSDSSSSSSSSSSEDNHSVFVGDLDPAVDDAVLSAAFARYPSVREARVIIDPTTSMSKGYGFVRFSNMVERDLALQEMQSYPLLGRCLKLNLATPKKQNILASAIPPPPPSDPEDPYNTTLFVGGIDDTVSEELLIDTFLDFGTVVNVKIPSGRGCAFVQFATRAHAENAIKLHGSLVGSCRIRLSWGRPSQTASMTSQPQTAGMGASASAWMSDPSLAAMNGSYYGTSQMTPLQQQQALLQYLYQQVPYTDGAPPPQIGTFESVLALSS